MRAVAVIMLLAMTPSRWCFRQASLRRGLSMQAAKPANIVIIGGGFGGLYSALKLDRQLRDDEKRGKGSPSCSITLIDPKDKFVFLPLLYELAVGSASVVEVAPRYKDLLRDTKIRFVQGSAQDVDVASRSVSVRLADSEANAPLEFLPYDKMVIACGAQPNLSIIPGAKEHALPFCSIEHAYSLNQRLRALMDSNRATIRVCVIGGGYSGVEVSSTLAEYLGSRGSVSIVDRNEGIMVSSPAHNRRESEKVLRDLGVAVICNASVKEVTGDGVVYSTKQENDIGASAEQQNALLAADLVIATLGMAQSAIVQGLPLAKDRLGRVLTDRTLRSTSNADIYALGDCSCVEGESVPSTAQAAMQQCDIIASNVLLAASGLASSAPAPAESFKKFSFVPLGEMLTLGTKDAAVTSLGGLVELDGLAASVGRRLIYALRMPTPQQTVNALVASTIVMGSSELLKILDPRGKTKAK